MGLVDGAVIKAADLAAETSAGRAVITLGEKAATEVLEGIGGKELVNKARMLSVPEPVLNPLELFEPDAANVALRQAIQRKDFLFQPSAGFLRGYEDYGLANQVRVESSVAQKLATNGEWVRDTGSATRQVVTADNPKGLLGNQFNRFGTDREPTTIMSSKPMFTDGSDRIDALHFANPAKLSIYTKGPLAGEEIRMSLVNMMRPAEVTSITKVTPTLAADRTSVEFVNPNGLFRAGSRPIINGREVNISRLKVSGHDGSVLDFTEAK